MERNYWSRMRRQRMSRRSLLRASARAGVGAAGLALVGCGDDDDDDQQAAAQVQQQQQAMQQQAEQQAMQQEQQEAPAQQQQQQQQQAAVAQAQEEDRTDSQGNVIQTGGVFKRAAASQLTLIRFPWNSAGNNGTIDPTGYMYNCLTQYGGVQLNETANRFWEYANPDWEIKPDVAESWETPDNLTWVFNIKSNVMFHDGRAFTADDAAHSYEAIRDQGVSGGGSPAYNLGKVIAGTEAIDDSTMRLSLGEPRGFTGALTAYVRMGHPETAGSATAPALDVARNEEAVLIGTGPWRFDTDSYDPNTGWRLTPFPESHMGAPNMDEITYTIFSDADAIGIALEAGDIDSHNGIPLQQPRDDRPADRQRRALGLGRHQPRRPDLPLRDRRSSRRPTRAPGTASGGWSTRSASCATTSAPTTTPDDSSSSAARRVTSRTRTGPTTTRPRAPSCSTPRASAKAAC